MLLVVYIMLSHVVRVFFIQIMRNRLPKQLYMGLPVAQLEPRNPRTWRPYRCSPSLQHWEERARSESPCRATYSAEAVECVGCCSNRFSFLPKVLQCSPYNNFWLACQVFQILLLQFRIVGKSCTCYLSTHNVELGLGKPRVMHAKVLFSLQPLSPN